MLYMDGDSDNDDDDGVDNDSDNVDDDDVYGENDRDVDDDDQDDYNDSTVLFRSSTFVVNNLTTLVQEQSYTPDGRLSITKSNGTCGATPSVHMLANETRRYLCDLLAERHF